MSRPAGVVDGLLAGRYRLASLLGSGANGEVWRARDERLDRDVAVKVLRPELADDVTVRARFRAEARHAGRLRHPGVAAVFDFAEQDDGAWLVMELVDGAALSDVLRHQGRLTVESTLDVVEQAAAALQAAHDSGVVHRDVKPGNLLLRPDGRLSVTDFGIAHAGGAAALTRTGQVVGTAAYLSPEQARGEPVTAATDLYALGVVAYECLSGVRPFERDDPVAVLLAHLQTPPPPLPDDVPRPVADLVGRLMAKDPAHRPASARQLQQEVADLRRDRPTPVPRTAVPPTAVPPTAVLPEAVVPPPTVQAVPRTPAHGLAGRPGQRRAVRATAVALGLLALALGVRDALDDRPVLPAGGQPERPSSSAPPAPVTSRDEPVVQPQSEQPPQDPPVVVPADPEQLPGTPPTGGQQQPPQEQDTEQQERQEEQEQQQRGKEQREREREKEQQQREKDQDKEQRKAEERERDQGRGGG